MNLADWAPASPQSALPGYTAGAGAVTGASDSIVDPTDPTRFFTVAYYADQIAQFQATLIQLDATAQVFQGILATPGLSDADSLAVQGWLSDYAAKKTEIQATAKGVNAIVSTANAAGLGLPQVTLPTTLQQLPPVAIVGIAAAVAAAAAIVSWAAQQIVTAQNITAQIQSLPPDQRAAALAQIEAANVSPLTSVSNIVKWAAIAVGIYFAWRAWRDYAGRGVA